MSHNVTKSVTFFTFSAHGGRQHEHDITIREFRIKCLFLHPFISLYIRSKYQLYELSSAEITDDTLRISVSYGGGCEEHEFTLIASNTFMESDPVQLNISIVHNANLDPCERWVSEAYYFDLTPIKNMYLQNYPLVPDAPDPEPAAIALKFTGSLKDTLDLLYRF